MPFFLRECNAVWGVPKENSTELPKTSKAYFQPNEMMTITSIMWKTWCSTGKKVFSEKVWHRFSGTLSFPPEMAKSYIGSWIVTFYWNRSTFQYDWRQSSDTKCGVLYRKRSTFQNVWRQSSGTKCTWTLTSNVLKSTPFPIERYI